MRLLWYSCLPVIFLKFYIKTMRHIFDSRHSTLCFIVINSLMFDDDHCCGLVNRVAYPLHANPSLPLPSLLIPPHLFPPNTLSCTTVWCCLLHWYHDLIARWRSHLHFSHLFALRRRLSVPSIYPCYCWFCWRGPLGVGQGALGPRTIQKLYISRTIWILNCMIIALLFEWQETVFPIALLHF